MCAGACSERREGARAVDERLQRAALETGFVRRVREHVHRHRTHEAGRAFGRRHTWFESCVRGGPGGGRGRAGRRAVRGRARKRARARAWTRVRARARVHGRGWLGLGFERCAGTAGDAEARQLMVLVPRPPGRGGQGQPLHAHGGWRLSAEGCGPCALGGRQ